MKNKLLNLIKLTQSKINQSTIRENLKYNLIIYLELIEFSINKDLFFATISLIRCYRNNIYAVIKETHFMPIYSYISSQYFSWKSSSDIARDCPYFNNEENNLKLEQQYQKIVTEFKNALIDVDFKNIEKKVNFVSAAYHIYHRQPIYFYGKNLNNIDLSTYEFSKDNEAILRETDKYVREYVKKFINESVAKKLIRANIICNNGIHKNNYDAEDFEEFYYEDNTLNSDNKEILKNLIEVYNEILFEFLKLKNLNT